MVTHSHNLQEFIAKAQARRGITSPVKCRRCGQLLTDPVSIRAGIGPECAEADRAERRLEAAWPRGTRVRITGGSNEGLTGTVMLVNPRKAYPVKVWLDGRMCAERFPADRLERIGFDA
jgi:hypothetical protein